MLALPAGAPSARSHVHARIAQHQHTPPALGERLLAAASFLWHKRELGPRVGCSYASEVTCQGRSAAPAGIAGGLKQPNCHTVVFCLPAAHKRSRAANGPAARHRLSDVAMSS